MEEKFKLLFRIYLQKKPKIVYNLKYNKNNYNIVFNDWLNFKKDNHPVTFIVKYPIISSVFEMHKQKGNRIIIYHSSNNSHMLVIACLDNKRISTLLPYYEIDLKISKLKGVSFLAIYQ